MLVVMVVVMVVVVMVAAVEECCLLSVEILTSGGLDIRHINFLHINNPKSPLTLHSLIASWNNGYNRVASHFN
ncbi:hypothetical protein E2C01_074475 [Portunus trituberculatus]|uniref:Secreted protein n=1 Tax=Portunus trituberculatus TaxID=210409 RepID=A0A5B7IGD7_PORTR|nr:hypothetical protein [Portunus trituberculatus]